MSISTGSAAFDAMITVGGFRFSEEATVSAKDDSLSISRVKVGNTLAAEDATNNAAIVHAVAASEGGQVAINGVSDKCDGLSAAIGVNVLLGNPLTDEDAIDAAANRLIRDKVRDRATGFNRAADTIRDQAVAESAKRQATADTEESHVGEDAAELAQA